MIRQDLHIPFFYLCQLALLFGAGLLFNTLRYWLQKPELKRDSQRIVCCHEYCIHTNNSPEDQFLMLRFRQGTIFSIHLQEKLLTKIMKNSNFLPFQTKINSISSSSILIAYAKYTCKKVTNALCFTDLTQLICIFMHFLAVFCSNTTKIEK